MNLVKIHIFWMRCFSLAGWMASSGQVKMWKVPHLNQLTPATKPPRSVAGVSWFLVGFVPPWLFCRFLVGWSKLECPVHALGPLGKVRHSGGGTSISGCSLSQTSLSFAFTVCVCCHLNRWLVLQCEPQDSSAHSRLIFEVDAVSDFGWVLLLAHASVNSLLRAQRLRGG